jgi:lipid-binding SYLF domain-containing protein
VVEQDADSTTAIYGRDVPFRKVLTGGVTPPSAAAPFMAAVRHASHKASEHEAKKEEVKDDKK